MSKLIAEPWPETEHWSTDPVEKLCQILHRVYPDVPEEEILYWIVIPHHILLKRGCPVAEDLFVDAWIESKDLVVFFDTIEDYTEPTRMVQNIVVDKKLSKLGYHVIHLPYFVQMDETTTEHYFGTSVDVACEARSGFYYTDEFTPNEYTPARFCSMGWNKFIEQLYSLPKSTFADIMESLQAHAKEFGQELTTICFPLGLECKTCPMHKEQEELKAAWNNSIGYSKIPLQ